MSNQGQTALSDEQAYKADPVEMFNSAAQEGVPLSRNNTKELDSDIYEKSVDEETFSNFTVEIDNQEKEARQNAIEGDGNTFMGGNKKQKNDDIDNLRDIAELSDDLQEARQEQMMRFSNGFEFTKEEFETANDEIIEEIENDPVKYAEEKGISVAEAMLVLDMAKDAKESGTFNEVEARAKYGDKIVDVYQGDFEETVEAKREVRNELVTKRKLENVGVEANADLTDKQQAEKTQLDYASSDELGFGNVEDINSTSMAKSVSQDETTTASLTDNFTTVAQLPVAEPDIPTQQVSVEHQSALTV